MKVVILCGGQGTRIRDIADDIPKPMIPIGQYPIVWHIMSIYARYGYKDFILCLGHKGNVIKNFFMNQRLYTHDVVIGPRGSVTYHASHAELDWQVTLAETGLRSMTGARIARIKKYVGEDDFMITYGDGVSDINIDRLLDFHRSHNRILTVTGVRPPGRFGEMIADANGRILEFNEKPQATAGRISGGFFVAKSKLFDYLHENEDLVFEQGPMRALVRDKELMMYEHDGFWQPMDTSREYQLLNAMYESNTAPWIVGQ